jgi:hypothetical protein
MKNTQIYVMFFSKFDKNFVAVIDVTISNDDVTITSRAFASTMEQFILLPNLLHKLILHIFHCFSHRLSGFPAALK